VTAVGKRIKRMAARGGRDSGDTAGTMTGGGGSRLKPGFYLIVEKKKRR